MSKKILIIGCGQLGSRHLQAVASLKEVSEVHVVDVRDESLELGKSRLEDIVDLNTNIKFAWFNELNQESANGDLCIVATQAKGRCDVIKTVAEQLGYSSFLVEKIVSQSIEDYEDLLATSIQKKLSIWVNCKSRAYSVSKYIKSKLDPNDPIVYSAIAGNHGLVNNGIHDADLFNFFDGSDHIHSGGAMIEPVLHTSKRNAEIFDLSGSLNGKTDKGSTFNLTYTCQNASPEILSILSEKARFMVDITKKYALESYQETQWNWKEIPIAVDEDWMVSVMTKKFVVDILNLRRCELPTIKECHPAHKFILSELLPHFVSLSKTNYDYCPVT